MNNQDSSPALTFPNVPDDFCPTGNWQAVFQQFIDDVLSNGTINVPGLGDVTPAQIATLSQQVAVLTDQVADIETDVAALKLNPVVNARYGTVTGIAAGDTVTIGVTFSSQLPSSNYGVSLTPIYSSGTPATTPLFTLVTGTKTTSGFTIRVDNNISSITSVDWMAVHTS